MTKTESKKITFRLPPFTAVRLKKMAEQENRSINKQLTHIVDKYWDSHYGDSGSTQIKNVLDWHEKMMGKK